jgi:hypothetical protein
MHIANVENSEIDVSGIRTVLVQGDSSYPIIRFVLDPSLTGLSWRVRGTYTDTNIAVLSSEITAVESETEITLDWSVSSDFTTYDGDMQLVLVGSNDLGTTVVKALAEITIQKDWSIGTMQTVTLNLFEQLMAQAWDVVSGAISTHNTDAGAHPSLIQNKNWLYDGRDLSAIFTAAQLIAAVRADDWSNIRVGDYWPIALSGTYRDYGSYTCPSGTNYYSDTGLTTLVGATGASYQATYVSAAYCSIVISATTYYVSTAACLDYFARTLSSAVFKMEVAGINPYIGSGDTALTSPHIYFISRDCVPHTLKMRTALVKWTDAVATNPWLGSALYKTLNEATYGLLPLIAATDIGAYIYSGTGSGIRMRLETKAAGGTTATNSEMASRGKILIPSEAELSPCSRMSEAYSTVAMVSLPLYIGSLKHRLKGAGDGGSRSAYWTMSSAAGTATNFTYQHSRGAFISATSNTALYCPIGFIVT